MKVIETIYVLKVLLDVCLEITYSAIAKFPEIFFNALKTRQNEKSYIFREIVIPEIHVRLFENFQKL